MRKGLSPLVIASTVAAAVLIAFPGLAPALPPDSPTAATTRMELERLTVRAQSDEPYHRKEQFGNGWITQAGCTTRERVLLRDGLDAKKGPGCAISATHWRSIYDDISVTASGDVQIDHIVPLKNAFHSGAAAWTRQQRVAFANDLTDPELITSTIHANESKGDRGPEEWLPRKPARCLYARWWVDVKATWKLSVSGAEKRALRRILVSC